MAYKGVNRTISSRFCRICLLLLYFYFILTINGTSLIVMIMMMGFFCKIQYVENGKGSNHGVKKDKKGAN